MSETKSSKPALLISDFLSYAPLKLVDVIHQPTIKQFPVLYQGLAEIADPNTHIGIEIEVENLNDNGSNKQFEFLDNWHAFWRQDSDDSLRNNGAEFISTPLKGNAIPTALTLMHDYLNFYHQKHKFTSRTSVHVHVNCRHMETKHFLNLLLLYLVVEPIFYYYADLGSEIKRSENNYCVPIDASKFNLDLPKIIREFLVLDGKNVKNALNLVLSFWRKYNGLNLLPLKNLGTIEFRHMHGTSNPIELMNWINMILNLKKYAEKITLEQLKQEVFELNTNSSYLSFTQRVLGPSVQLPFELLHTELEESSTSLKTVLSFWELRGKFAVRPEKLKQSRLFNHYNFKSFRRENKKLEDLKREHDLLLIKASNSPDLDADDIANMRRTEALLRDEQKRIKSLVTRENFHKMGY